jgi:hypothetical protein
MDEEESSESGDNWSAHDKDIDYGSAERLTDGSQEWECRS